MEMQQHQPFVKFLDTITTGGIQNSHQMCKYSLPNTKFELMEEVDNEHRIKVETKFRQALGKGVLQ
jgi:hypothetical protein